jgi:hypothetical protein
VYFPRGAKFSGELGLVLYPCGNLAMTELNSPIFGWGFEGVSFGGTAIGEMNLGH